MWCDVFKKRFLTEDKHKQEVKISFEIFFMNTFLNKVKIIEKNIINFN